MFDFTNAFDIVDHAILLETVGIDQFALNWIVSLQRGRIACNAQRCYTYGNSVRPSVLLSHAGTLSRRMKIESFGLHYEVAKTP